MHRLPTQKEQYFLPGRPRKPGRTAEVARYALFAAHTSPRLRLFGDHQESVDKCRSMFGARWHLQEAGGLSRIEFLDAGGSFVVVDRVRMRGPLAIRRLTVGSTVHLFDLATDESPMHAERARRQTYGTSLGAARAFGVRPGVFAPSSPTETSAPPRSSTPSSLWAVTVRCPA